MIYLTVRQRESVDDSIVAMDCLIPCLKKEEAHIIPWVVSDNGCVPKIVEF